MPRTRSIWRLPLKAIIAPVLASLLLGGCVTAAKEQLYSSCRALATRDWSAHVVQDKEAKFPFKEEASLVVSGTVQVPTGGFELSIIPGSLVRLEPPVQQVILRTIAPEGMATQAITEERVTGSVPWDKRAKSVSIRCGDGTIASIPTIDDRRTAEAPAG
jgi:hypothetical protein